MSLISLMSITLTACGLSPDTRIGAAGTKAGQARDTTVKAALPSICGEKVPHITAKVGQEAVTYAKLSNHQIDVANSRLLGCYATGNKLLGAVQTTGPAGK